MTVLAAQTRLTELIHVDGLCFADAFDVIEIEALTVTTSREEH